MDALLERLTANLNDPLGGKALCTEAETPVVAASQGAQERLRVFLDEGFGLSVAAADLVPLSRDDALFVATELLLGPMWGNRSADRAAAEQLALGFVDSFGDDAEFFSTYAYRIDRSDASYSARGKALLDNSFDMGILAANAKRVGILWMGDED